MKSRRSLCILAVAVGFAWPAVADDAPFDVGAIHKAVGAIASEIRAGYIFPDKGNKAAAEIETALAAKAYDGIATPEKFAERMTHDLQSATGDGHMRVIVGLPPAPPAKPSGPDDAGFEKIEVLAGNIGYIRLIRFLPPEKFKDAADAAMRQIADTKAIILDMRGNGGGHPRSVAYLSGFFLDPARPIHINDIVWRNRGTADFRTEAFWTSATPTHYLVKPVYVLVGPGTYSGGEEFAYDLQILKRATVVGTGTRGGANPGGFAPIGANLFVVVPSGRAENLVTHTNWEGVGIRPDVRSDADAALDTAVKLASR